MTMTQSNATGRLDLILHSPGKIILFGEHSVVYGKKAIAATLGMYTTLHLTETDANRITLQFRAIDFEESFLVTAVRENFPMVNEDDAVDHTTAEDDFRKFYAKYGTQSLTPAQERSLITFFHSFRQYTGPSIGLTVWVDTSLPVGSGAGSSASFSVVITTAVLILDLVKSDKLSKYVVRCEDNVGFDMTNELRDLVSRGALSCERIFHGTPSGIDHSVIIRGSALEFIKAADGNQMTSVDGGAVDVLLVDTHVEKSTMRQVAIGRELKERFPTVVGCVLDAMGSVSEDAIRTLRLLKTGPTEESERRLGQLIDLNHGLLRTFGVSHESLELVCNIAKRHGFSAKLTGAGGGGLAFVYLPAASPIEKVALLSDELERSGFSVRRVTLGGPGLRIKSLSL